MAITRRLIGQQGATFTNAASILVNYFFLHRFTIL